MTGINFSHQDCYKITSNTSTKDTGTSNTCNKDTGTSNTCNKDICTSNTSTNDTGTSNTCNKGTYSPESPRSNIPFVQVLKKLKLAIIISL